MSIVRRPFSVNSSVYKDQTLNNITTNITSSIPFINSSITPANTAGSLAYDPNLQAIYYSNGEFWIALGGGSLGGNCGTVTNVTDLRAYPATNNPQSVILEGDVIGGDGFTSGVAGIYYYDPTDTTTPDNGVTIIVASNSATPNARWKLLPYGQIDANYINVASIVTGNTPLPPGYASITSYINTLSPAESFGMSIYTSGGNANPGAAIFIQSDNTGSTIRSGIVFYSGNGQPIAQNGTIIYAGNLSITNGINLEGTVATNATLLADINSGSTAGSSGLLLRAAGGHANAGAAIFIQSDNTGSTVATGIHFYNGGGSGQPISSTGTLIGAINSIAALGIDFSGSTFSTATIRLGTSGALALQTCTTTATSSAPSSVTFGTGVTANNPIGLLTYTVSTAAATTSTSTVTCSSATNSSLIRIDIQSYTGTWVTNGYPCVTINSTTVGSFVVRLTNTHVSNALTGTLKIAYRIIN